MTESKTPRNLNTTPVKDDQIINIRKWIEALRSGEYEQGRECLIHTVNASNIGGRQSTTTYCCLGVYGVINDYEDLIVVTTDNIEIDPFYSDQSFLPEERFRSDTGLDKYIDQVTLSKWNDADVTFDDIADALEYYLINGVLPRYQFDWQEDLQQEELYEIE